MDKLLTFSGYDHAGPHIFPLESDRDRTIGHIKMARPLPPRVEHYIKTAKAIPNKTQLLIDALGADEYWGDNVNGDAFPELALRHDGEDYGFRTFEKYGHPFKHHVNKDPARAYGDRVTLSEYDPVMHRVLLIVAVHNDKCQDILRDLAQEKYWDVSMGCRVPWDECSICRNRARNRSEYCPHAKYQLRQILPDGRKVKVYNRLPKFFDISFVIIGAEKASHVLLKVAHAHAYEIRSSAIEWEKYALQLKASSTKEAVIDKTVPSNIPPSSSKIAPLDQAEKQNLVGLAAGAGAAKAHEAPLPSELLDRLAGFPLDQLASTLTALGIPLKPEEFQRIVLVKMGHRVLADKLAAQRAVFDEYKLAAAPPAWAKPLERFDVGAVNQKIAMLLRDYMAERSCYPEPLAARIGVLEKRAADPDLIYNRQWYPVQSDDEKTKASGLSGFVPAGLALAAAFMILKKQFPQMADKGTLSVLMKHPWLVPILIAGGVGISAGLNSLLSPRPLGDAQTIGSVDGMGGPRYDATKTASLKAPWTRLGLIPLTYIYAGIQRRRAERGEPLGTIDRFIASRPDLAAITSFAAAPTVERGVKAMLKHGSVASDVAMYTIGSPSHFVPGVLAGALLDSTIFHGIARLAQRKKEMANANAE